VRLSHKIVLTLAIFQLGVAGLILALRADAARNKSSVVPGEQDCQPAAVALRLRSPYPHIRPDVEPDIRLATNCRRFGFQFFLKTLEVTHLHYFEGGRFNWANLYGLNGDGENDLVVHVGHVQPATSLQDPTISTNLDFLTAEVRILQLAHAKFDGRRAPLEGHDLDRFRPFDDSWRIDKGVPVPLFFLSRPAAAVELVGVCQPVLGKLTVDANSRCKVLAYSHQDGLVFSVVLPQPELGRLNDIVWRSLGLIRKWRVPA
jgi:hypothetical protein